jgi:hypothetical protein
MNEHEEQRIAEMEALFRDVNEHIAETAERFETDTATFYCECDDLACGERLDVPLEDYDEVRSESTHFLLKPGHENPHVERVVARGDEYAVVEKKGGVLKSIVRRLDPRGEPA